MKITLLEELQNTITDLSLINLDYHIEKFQREQGDIKTIIKNINNLYSLKEYLIFSRLDIDENKICNFCTKIASYSDIENKSYCWFHRSQYE